MRRSKLNYPIPRSAASAAVVAIGCAILSLTALGEEPISELPVVPEVPPRYVESPFRLDDADVLGLSVYLRFPSKPPLFYPRALDVFSWIDLAKPNWRSLQDLIERPDLADEVFPTAIDAPNEAQGFFASEPVESTVSNALPFQDPVDQYIARLTSEVSGEVDESVLTERMRINPPSEEDLLKGIAFFESLRNEGRKAPASRSESPPPLVEQPMSDPAAPEVSSPPVPVRPAPVQPSLPPVETFLPDSPQDAPDAVSSTEATLRMAAKMPLPDGTQRPAFASEFFLTTRQLEDLLSEAIPSPTAANDVRQLIRLWAESEKRSGGGGVKLALNVKSVLIKAQVGKVLTDFKGEARVGGLRPDDYYLIGIDKDDETGIVTIWSKPIAIARGENHVEVSAQDVVWSK